MSGRLLVGLMQHYELLGEYGRAEDMLFRLIQFEDQKRPVLELPNAFFQRLEGLPDEVLVAGNLPRAEIEAGRREIIALHAREELPP